jgi:hypothetical protein
MAKPRKPTMITHCYIPDLCCQTRLKNSGAIKTQPEQRSKKYFTSAKAFICTLLP